MKGQIFTAFLLTAIIFLTVVASAATFSVSPSTSIFSQNINSTNLTVTNTNETSLLNVSTSASITITGENSYTATFTISGDKTNINSSSPRQLVIQPSSSIDYSNFKFGKVYSAGYSITNSNNANDSSSLTLQIARSICDSGDTGRNLSISELSITNNGEGTDDSWLPLDEVEIKVIVDNINTDEDAKIDTVVELKLYDSKGREKLKLDKIDLGKIKGGDDATARFLFVVPADLGVDDSTYYIYAKAYRDGKESDICTSIIDSSYYQKISIDREDSEERQIVFDRIEFSSSPALCGEDVTLKARVYNIGDSDQDKVMVSLYNKELKINSYTVLDNLDQKDTDKSVEFSFQVPKNATEKNYVFELRAGYNFDDSYKAEESIGYEDWTELKTFSFGVQGNCIKPLTKIAEISAILLTSDAEIKAGKEITIKATVKNPGTASAIYTISLEGIDSFATAKSITPSSLILEAGKSQDVLITLLLNKDAEGEQIFSIKATSNSQEAKQQVSLSIPKSGISGITGFSISDSIKSNWFIWVIVAVNIILIVLIIVVAMKVSRG